jgi:hypothetical protein
MRISGAALNSPEQSSPLGAHPSREGWAQEGCSDSL